MVEDAVGGSIITLPVTDITVSPPTFGTPVATNISSSDPFVLYPSDRRNILDPTKYVLFTSTPNWKSATAITGTYSGGASIATGNSFEACCPTLLDGGLLRVFFAGTPGYCYSDGNGSGWTAFTVANGLNVSTGQPYDVGQGDFIDMKALGLWPVASAGASAGDGVSIPGKLNVGDSVCIPSGLNVG